MNSIDWNEIRIAQLINALAFTVGLEKGRAAVEEAVRLLGISTEVVGPEQAKEILETVAQNEGMLGITARFLRVRIESGRPLPSMAPPSIDSVSVPVVDSVSAPPSSRVSLIDAQPLDNRAAPMMNPVFSRRLLISLLTGTLGRELADSSVNEAADQLGLPKGEMTQDQALSVLEMLAERSGKVGVTARFAKARLLLRQTRS